ncbi:MAG: alpha-glucan family phosphorylase [Gammaproteobacteria bacterium]
MTGTRFDLEVQPVIPEALARLEELANDLVYSWNRPIRTLFAHLDRDLWHACGHNLKIFLRRVAQDKLDAAASNLVYLQDYRSVLSDYDTYLAKEVNTEVRTLIDPAHNLIAYFCAEFGLHESLPIYSGGLGILAGDYCKAASDLGLPFVAVGLLYRVGSFEQTLDGAGNQQLKPSRLDFNDLPISPVVDARHSPLTVTLDLPGREVVIQIWQARVGHIRLFLLDTDVSANSDEDRHITHQLYGGDKHTRIQQEMVLGIGGVRALRAMGIAPTIWHINEGHAAFLVLERCRALVESGIGFGAALEQVAAGTVFTTHTPVPAGHDIFDTGMVGHYFRDFWERLGICEEEFLRLGISSNHGGSFNQTALAFRSSRFHNGVSRTHAETAARMEGAIWPEIPTHENPIECIANGVHVQTFLAAAWVHLFDLRFGIQWRNELLNEAFWERIDHLPSSAFWSTRQLLKSDLMKELRERAEAQFRRNGYSQSLINRLTRHLGPDDDILIMGYGRRFATYKRATLVFSDPARLARLMNDPDRPFLIIFSGKAHPHDGPGQELIRAVHELSRQPQFEGKVLLIEGYDLALARRLVTGVDVWLNTPRYPLEASGTSGMKAGINGVPHLSILDGWWPEGYNGSNGWGIAPQSASAPAEPHAHTEAQELLDILEYEVIPLYYDRNRQGYSPGWINKSKASMKSLIPRYGAERMVMDYVKKFYSRVALQQERLAVDNFAAAIELAQWKQRVGECWSKVRLQVLTQPKPSVRAGEQLKFCAAVQLGGLATEDVVMECLVGSERDDRYVASETHRFTAKGTNAEGETRFELELTPGFSGLQTYKLRLYPYHQLLTHRFETGLMKWI